MKTNYTIERYNRVPGTLCKERLVIKSFRDSDLMHRFLNTGDNALHWKESSKGLKAGTYAYAGGNWHNVKSIDSSVLAHI